MAPSRRLGVLLALAPACTDDTASTAPSADATLDSTTAPAPTTGMTAPADDTTSGATSGVGPGATTGDPDVTGSTGSAGDTTLADTTTAGATSGGSTTTGVDEDAACIAANDPSTWSLHHGVPGSWLVTNDLEVAPTGATIYTTDFKGVLDLGDGPVVADGSYRFIASRTADCEFQWSTHLGGADGAIPRFAIAVDHAGNVVVAGGFYGEISSQSETLTAVPGRGQEEDMLLARYGPDGALDWAHRFGDSMQQYFQDLAIQADGTIVVGGMAEGTLDLGGEPIISDGPYIGVLAAFTPAGALLWQRPFPGVDDSVLFLGLDVASDDRIATYGLAGTVDLGGGALIFDDNPNFVAGFEPDGTHLWSSRFADFNHMPRHVRVDGTGDVIYAGDYEPDDLTLDAFVARINDQGVQQWYRNFNPINDGKMDIGGLAVRDEIVITGEFRGVIDFGGGPILGDNTVYVTRYDLTGVHLASEAFSGTSVQSARAAALGPDGELVIGGHFGGTFDLGAGPMIAVGQWDLYVHRFAP